MSTLSLASHGLTPGDQIYFVDVDPSDCGLLTGVLYNVLTTPTAGTFTVALADDIDQAEVDLALDIISGSILNAAGDYTPRDDAVVSPPGDVPTPTAPTVTSALVSGIVRLRVVLNDTAEAKVRNWEVQITHKYTDEEDITGSATGSNATDTITLASHGLVAGDSIRFKTLTGGSSVVVDQTYYVIASGLTSGAFEFSDTLGGSAFDLGSDISAATVVKVITAIADWTTPLTSTIPAGVAGGEELSVPALGNTNYTVRVRAQDVYGQFGAYSDEVDITTTEGSDSLAAALAAIANGVDGEVIDATNIMDNAIETRHIKANAVTADALAATLVLASLIQTAESGRRVEIDTAGIRLVDADESVVVNIPTDSAQPVYFKGEVVAETFSSQMENDLSGAIGVTGDAVMTLANGISAPATSPTVTAFQNQTTLNGGGSAANGGMGFDAGNLSVWVPANPSTGYVAHEYLLDTGEYVRSIEATGSTTTVTTTYGSTSHISDTAEATTASNESQIAVPIVMPRDGIITKVSIYLAGYLAQAGVRNAVWSNGGTLLDQSSSYFATERTFSPGNAQQYNKSLAGDVNYIGGNTYKVGAMLTSDSYDWWWDRDDGSGKTTYLGSGENLDNFTVTSTETTHKPNVYITYTYDVDSRLETQNMIGVATDGTYVYTLDVTGVVWKYDRTTGAHVSHSGVQTAITGTKANAGMFYDATAGELIITTATGTGAGVYPKFVRVNTSTLAVSSTVYSAAAGTTFNGTNDTFRGGFRLADPLNASAATYWVQTYTLAGVGLVYAYTFSGTTATQTADRDFGQASTIRYGIIYDSTNAVVYGRYSATLYAFTSWDWTTASAIYWFAHAWYDNAGTTHETVISPRTSLTLRRRENVRVANSAIPTGGADDPNRVRIYFKPNATDPGAGGLKLQATDALTSRDFATYDSAGAADGGGTPFPAGSPAQVASAKVRTDATQGSLGWIFYGDGSMKGPNPKVTVYAASGTTSSSGNWTVPTGIHHIIVEVVGGGGGGGGITASATAGHASYGESGGGGGYARKLYLAADLPAAGGTCAYVAGGGGAGGNAGNGATGTASTFAGSATTITGNGGGGGSRGSDRTADIVESGNSGGTATNGDINVTGGASGFSFCYIATAGSSGAGGDSALGGGAVGVRASSGSTSVVGNAGGNYGGGGSGAVGRASSTNRVGGNGGPGVVIITEFYAP